jgi:hypothetical protein
MRRQLFQPIFGMDSFTITPLGEKIPDEILKFKTIFEGARSRLSK